MPILNIYVDQETLARLEHAQSELQRTPKHLARYVNEFTFRLNDANVKHHTLSRLNSLLDAAVGKRLTYERLIG